MAKCKSRERGFTLIELLLVMGVIVTILVFAFNQFSQTKSSVEEQKILQELMGFNAGVTRLFNMQGNYAGLNNQLVIRNRIYPSTVRVDTTANTINSIYGAVTVQVNATDNTRFEITYANLPNDLCRKIVATFIPDNLVSIAGAGTVNITSVATARSNAVANASTVCGTTDPVASVTWTLR